MSCELSDAIKDLDQLILFVLNVQNTLGALPKR